MTQTTHDRTARGFTVSPKLESLTLLLAILTNA